MARTHLVSASVLFSFSAGAQDQDISFQRLHVIGQPGPPLIDPLEPERVLEYSHSRPIFRASGPIPTESHRVTIEVSGDGEQTRISVTVLGNATERELAHSEGGWRMALGNMKALLEGTSIVPMR